MFIDIYSDKIHMLHDNIHTSYMINCMYIIYTYMCVTHLFPCILTQISIFITGSWPGIRTVHFLAQVASGDNIMENHRAKWGIFQ